MTRMKLTLACWDYDRTRPLFDGRVKPDIVAPGNKIIEAESVNNLLVTQSPQLDAGVSPAVPRKQMFLSGSSMSSSVVSGGAALLLQANPTLTPNMVPRLST